LNNISHTAAGFLAVFVLLWLALFLCNNDVFRYVHRHNFFLFIPGAR
jgi:hypothetical protein